MKKYKRFDGAIQKTYQFILFSTPFKLVGIPICVPISIDKAFLNL
jgi:hypothetical protein